MDCFLALLCELFCITKFCFSSFYFGVQILHAYCYFLFLAIFLMDLNDRVLHSSLVLNLELCFSWPSLRISHAINNLLNKEILFDYLQVLMSSYVIILWYNICILISKSAPIFFPKIFPILDKVFPKVKLLSAYIHILYSYIWKGKIWHIFQKSFNPDG